MSHPRAVKPGHRCERMEVGLQFMSVTDSDSRRYNVQPLRDMVPLKCGDQLWNLHQVVTVSWNNKKVYSSKSSSLEFIPECIRVPCLPRKQFPEMPVHHGF